MTPTAKGTQVPQTYHPVVHFLVFFMANTLLAYGPLGPMGKVWTCLMFILLPFGLALMNGPGLVPKDHTYKKDLQVPLWGWFLVLSLGVVLRIQGLISLPVWPMWDDADSAYDSIHLAEHWTWSPVSGQIRLPSMYFWFEAILFKVLTPSLFTLWLLPAFFSLGGLGIGVWTVRRWSNGLWGFLASAFLALGFWPVYMGRFAIPASLSFFWMMGACAAVTHFWKSRGTKFATRASVLLGLWCGLGLYINSKSYPPILVLSLLFLWDRWRIRPRRPQELLPFFLPLLLVGLPEIPVLIFDVSKGHAHDFMIFFGPVDWSEQWSVSLSYLTVFLWGVLRSTYFHFGPIWGGFFNPILGSFMLLGAIEAVRRTHRGVLAAWAAVVFLFLVPGVFSRTLEMFRVLPLLPLGLGLAAWGAYHFLMALKPGMRGGVLALTLVLSTGTDLYHSWGPFHTWSIPGPQSLDSKAPERYRAFQVLDQVQKKEGPGIILTEFIPNTFDQSLLVACYPFNAARNPSLDPAKAKWLGMLIESSLRPYFFHHFPKAQFYELFPGLPAEEGLLDLVLLPLDGSSLADASRWRTAHQSIQDLFGTMPYHLSHPSFGTGVQMLLTHAELFRDDPFLRACYFEKLYYLWAGDENTVDQALETLQRSIQDCRKDPSLRLHGGSLWKDSADLYQKWKKDRSAELSCLYNALDLGYGTEEVYRRLAILEIQKRDPKKALQIVRSFFKTDPAKAQDPEWAGLYKELSGLK